MVGVQSSEPERAAGAVAKTVDEDGWSFHDITTSSQQDLLYYIVKFGVVRFSEVHGW